VLLTVRVHPRASRARTEWKDDVLEVWVNEPASEGRANHAVLEAVAKELGVRVSAVSMRSGSHARTKLVEVVGR
jgi:uncharacterized protein YggU (UPF0235/DUF167 family)